MTEAEKALIEACLAEMQDCVTHQEVVAGLIQKVREERLPTALLERVRRGLADYYKAKDAWREEKRGLLLNWSAETVDAAVSRVLKEMGR